MSVRIDIVNNALNLLGADSIVSIEDHAPEAQVMKNFYYIARDAVMEEAEWSFATKRFVPAKETAAPEWGWASAFTIPSNILRVTRVDRYDFDQGVDRRPAEYEVEGNLILCNEDEIFCKGIRRMEDEGGYSPLFAEAFGYKLAVKAALAITESNTKMQLMAGLYTESIAKAKARDGMQGTTRRFRSTTLHNARY